MNVTLDKAGIKTAMQRKQVEGSVALLLLMNMVATAAKTGDPMAAPYLVAGAVTIMPDGVAIYQSGLFQEVMEKELGKYL